MWTTTPDAGVEVEYSLDGGPWARTTATDVTLSVATAATHVVTVRVAVPSGCSASAYPPQSPLSSSWYEYDVAPGAPVFITTPDAASAIPYSDFVLSTTAHPLQSFLQCAVDGEWWIGCDVTVRVGPLSPGVHTLRVRTVDVSGSVHGPVAAYQWSIQPSSGSTLVAAVTDGPHTLRVWATDPIGNVQLSPTEYDWLVDTQPPVTRLTVSAPALTNAAVVVVTVACDGEGLPDQCVACWWRSSLAVLQQTSHCATNKTLVFPYTADGVYTINVQTTDAAGNDAAALAIAQWTWDTTPPVTNATLNLSCGVVDGGRVAASAAFVLPSHGGVVVNSPVVCLAATASAAPSAVVAPTGVVYRVTVDGGGNGTVPAAPGAGATTVVLRSLTPAAHTVALAAVDGAGNVDNSPWTVVLVVDVSAPRVAFLPSSSPPSLTNGTEVRFVVVVDGEVPGMYNTVDVVWTASPAGAALTDVHVVATNATATAVTVPITAAVPLGGTYTVSVSASDRVGNTNSAGASATIVVDHTPPSASCVSPYAAFSAVNSSSLSMAATATDSQSSVTWVVMLDDGPWAAPASVDAPAVVFTNVSQGVHTLRCGAVDAAGNFQPPPYDAVTVTVDTDPPLVAVTSSLSAFTQATLIDLCVHVSDLSAFSVTVALDGVVQPQRVTHSSDCFVLVVSKDGAHTAALSAVDVVGNVAPVTTVSWIVDRVPPEDTLTILPSDYCNTQSETTVCSSGAALTFQEACNYVVGAEAPCTPRWMVVLLQPSSDTNACGVPINFTALTPSWTNVTDSSAAQTAGPIPVDGLYALSALAVDAAGNIGASTEYSWWVDSTPPAAPTILSPPASIVYTSSVSFKLQLQGDDSPGQTSFAYILVPPPANGTSDLTLVPTEPIPNDAVVVLTLTTALKDVPYSLQLFSIDQAGFVSPPTAFTWTVASTGPVVAVVRQPAATCGLQTVTFVLQALWSTGSGNSSLAGTVVTGASFQVQVPGAAVFATVPRCRDGSDVCNAADVVCGDGACQYTYTVTSAKSATYTIQFQAVNSGATGAATAVSWSFLRCAATEFAVLNGTDGAVQVRCAGVVGLFTREWGVDEGLWSAVGAVWLWRVMLPCVVFRLVLRGQCQACPQGGNCAAQDLTLQSDIVAQVVCVDVVHVCQLRCATLVCVCVCRCDGLHSFCCCHRHDTAGLLGTVDV